MARRQGMDLPKLGGGGDDDEIGSVKDMITQYCEGHDLQATLNSVINACVKARPDDPFGFMSTMLKEKSNAETGILSVVAREVLDGLGRPTIETEVTTETGTYSAQVSSGLDEFRGMFAVATRRDPSFAGTDPVRTSPFLSARPVARPVARRGTAQHSTLTSTYARRPNPSPRRPNAWLPLPRPLAPPPPTLRLARSSSSTKTPLHTSSS